MATRAPNRRGSNVVAPGGKGTLRSLPHEFSPAIARKVETLAALGLSQETIGFAVDLAPDTIRKYYRDQLDKGLLDANRRVGAAILTTALGERVECSKCAGTGGTAEAVCGECGGTGEGKDWRREPNTTAQIWWSKNRMGWTDKERIEHVGDGGGAILHEQRSSGDIVRNKLLQIRKRIANDGDSKD
jgi:hypothetical protein